MNLEIVNQFFTNKIPENIFETGIPEIPNSCTKIIPERNFQVPFFHLHWNHGEGQHVGVSSWEIQEITFQMGPDPIVTPHKFSQFAPQKRGHSQKETIV